MVAAFAARALVSVDSSIPCIVSNKLHSTSKITRNEKEMLEVNVMQKQLK
jgi:hypothetical protein